MSEMERQRKEQEERERREAQKRDKEERARREKEARENAVSLCLYSSRFPTQVARSCYHLVIFLSLQENEARRAKEEAAQAKLREAQEKEERERKEREDRYESNATGRLTNIQAGLFAASVRRLKWQKNLQNLRRWRNAWSRNDRNVLKRIEWRWSKRFVTKNC